MTNFESLAKIQEIQDEANRKIAEIKGQATSELVRAIARNKEEYRDLCKKYEELTGKSLDGSPASEQSVVRRRLSNDEKSAVTGQIVDLLRSKPEGVKISDILSAVDAPVTFVRSVLKTHPEIRTEGSRATAVYKI